MLRPRLSHRLSASIALAAWTCAILGCCGGGPKLYEVTGTLTHNGNPLPNMGVEFIPIDGSRGSYGVTDDNGQFTLAYTTDQKGVVPGEHVVAVDYYPEDPEELVAYQAGELEVTGDLQQVLEKYDDPERSPCRVTIDSDVSNLEVKLD